MPRNVSLEPIGNVIQERIDMLKTTLKEDVWDLGKRLRIRATIKTLEGIRAKTKSWCTPSALKLRKLSPRERDAAIWFVPGP